VSEVGIETSPGPGPGDPGAARRRPAPLRRARLDRAMLPDDLRTLCAGTVAVFLMIFWSVDDGGTDARTWYWGALVALAALALTLVLSRGAVASLPRAVKLGLACFALYVAWSYLSMTWASYAGLALEGSNRTLLYLLLFALMAVLPWRHRTALLVLGAYAAGIGVIAVALLFRFVLGDSIGGLFFEGRMVAPTGYFNSSGALFTVGALVATALAARRGMPAAMRGLYAAFACADLMLAFAPQSRGWLFTLPVVGLYAALVMAGRLRCVAIALPVAGGLLIDIHPLLRLFLQTRPAALTDATIHAGKIGLLCCAGVFAVVAFAAMLEAARQRGPWPAVVRRALGGACVLLALVAMAAGLWVVSAHHPGAFISREWHGFTRESPAATTSSHFVEVGSGRYDIWKSALQAFRAHPIGGLGQDNFGDWYLTHRHTTEEPLWTHSLWLRLLAHTGIVGFVLFGVFLLAGFVAAIRSRRRGGEPERMLVGAALLPLGVWLIHGSIDWFWEFPALSGPALGFLAMAGRLRAPGPGSAALAGTHPAGAQPGGRRPAGAQPGGRRPAEARPGGHRPVEAEPAGLTRGDRARSSRLPRPVTAVVGTLALIAATIVLGLPYLAIRELDLGITQSQTNVDASLADFRASHQLNPLMSDPGTLGGSVALVNGRPATAAALYRQAVRLEPGDWIAWLGRGLAASAQGNVAQARRSFRVAMRLDSDQAAVRDAWKRVGTKHPLSAQQAFDEINSVP